jgi:endogenous inhibitor of DNA gyrase (YacG/DUF329 family)
MIKNVVQRICDNCKKEVKQGEEHYFGGSPFNCWLSITKTNGSTALSELQKDKGPWDFCSNKCAIEFLSKIK